MGGAERQFQHPNQPVRQIGGGSEPRARELAHALRVRGHVAHHPRRGGQHQRPGLGGVEHRLLVLLHVLGIGERQAFHHRQQADQRSVDPPGLGPHQLGGVRVALLRHDRAAGGEGVGQAHEAIGRAAPDHDLLGEARQVHGRDRGGGEELEREVPVRHRIQRIGRRPVEAEAAAGHLPVDREAGAGERGRAERVLVQPRPAIGEAAAVAVQHFHIGQQMVPEGHRLGGLQMGEAGHRIGGMRPGLFGQAAHQVLDLGGDAVDGIAHPEAEIGRHLVVAAARGVQPLAGLADTLGQPRLDVHVNVLERLLEGELAALDLRRDAFQPGADGSFVLGGDQADMREHGGMRERTANILAPELAVEADRGIYLLHDHRRPRGEAPAPLDVRGRVAPVFVRDGVRGVVQFNRLSRQG